MSWSWLWFIVDLLFLSISLGHSRYIRLPTVNASELSPIGTPITQLLHVLPSSNWEFTFLTRTSIISYFLLDDLKGTITVKRPLDREDLCRLGICSCFNECLLKLEINALSDIHTHIIYLPIQILDENDNFCYFSNDIYSLNISENVHINTRLILPIAHDPDQTPNNIQSYALVDNNSTEFRLDNQLTPSIIVTQELDREKQEKYEFKFCAYEGPTTQQRSCCTNIHLTITDINDNSPIFQHDQQTPVILKISEFTPIHTELIQMKAFDPDQGLNGQVQYTFSKWTLNDVTIAKIFSLNPTNGSLSLIRQLDYEERSNYELQIQAKDLGLNAIPSYATVIIQVIDENDCSPEIFPFSPSDVQLVNNSDIYIVENLSIGTPILYLTVSDCDSNDNGRVTVELLSSKLQQSIVQLDKLTDNTYIVKTNIHLDREENSFYTFSFITYDHGQPKHTIESQFHLYLIDINDNSPRFDSSTNYTFYIDENNPENLIIHTIKIFDPDEDERITLKLQFPSEKSYYEHLFSLNEFNQLIVLKSLDYEKQISYEFSIQAEDKVGHQTNVPIFIYINDLNDNSVRFLKNFTRFQIEENQDNQTLIGFVYAEDEDLNSNLIYSIHPNDEQQLQDFIQLETNGSLYTKKRIDREEISLFNFHVIVNDSLHTDILEVEIEILDQNDNKPLLNISSPFCFVFNSTTNYNETIQIDLPAYDPDENQNGQITFSMINPSSNDLHLFSNGSLVFQPTFTEYHFDLILHDNGKPNQLSTTYKNFVLLIVYDQLECRNYSLRSSIQFDQQTFIYFISIILITLACFTFIILIICCCFYIRHEKHVHLPLIHKKLPQPTSAGSHLTPSFSSSLNEDVENDTLLLSSPSPQFTAMTTVSTSSTTTTKTNDSTRLTTFIDRHPTTKSSSLSSSSSSTYVKMSRSFDDEML